MGPHLYGKEFVVQGSTIQREISNRHEQSLEITY